VALNKAVCVAGDRARVNLPLPSEVVSRAHALFLSDEQGIYVRDLASKNHLFVNEKAVREAALHDGDHITIGPYEFRCDDVPEPQANGAEHAPASELKTADGSSQVPLKGRSVVIGRRDDCDVIIDGELVSKAHAVIFELDGRHCIRDLRSRHGTFVNDKRIGQSGLNPDDQIRIGDATLIYQAATTPVEVAVPGPDLAAEEPDLAADDETPAEPKPAVVPEDLNVIPLMEDSAELKAVAADFAKERAGEDEKGDQPEAAPAPAPGEPKSESGIIPLLDDSESAPGLAEPKVPQSKPAKDSDIPIGFAPDDEEKEPPQSILGPAVKPKNVNAAPPGAGRSKNAKERGPKSRARGAMNSRR
jgi:pSer/pThr/pTyr-binding forkhead associated (FHA) protein